MENKDESNEIVSKKCKYILCRIRFRTMTSREYCCHLHEIRQKRLRFDKDKYDYMPYGY